jgi:hypothetical protein
LRKTALGREGQAKQILNITQLEVISMKSTSIREQAQRKLNASSTQAQRKLNASSTLAS